MASIEFIQKRIEGKKAELDKLEKKLARIQKAAESNYELNNPYFYSERDMRYTLKEIDNATAAVKKYELQLEEEGNKAASRNVPAITEFLDDWEQKMITFFLAEYEKYGEACKEYKIQRDEMRIKLDSLPYTARWKKDDPQYNEYQELDEAIDDLRERFKATWVHVTQFDHGTLDWETTMRKDIAEEKKRKYDFILERVCSIVGTITDASGLSVGAKGDLNGIIIGTDGKAHVQTIGAGGWRIQKFHFRTLINEVK